MDGAQQEVILGELSDQSKKGQPLASGFREKRGLQMMRVVPIG
jgi:hypothetical protein